VDALDDLYQTLSARGIVFAMARVKYELRATLRAGGFVQKVGEDRIFMTLPTAVDAYVSWHVERHGIPPPGLGTR
jgi:sulfate permease, SulP family